MKHLTVCALVAIFASPSAFGQTLRCPDLGEAVPSMAREAFVLPYSAGTAALSEGRLQDAITLVDQAAPHAMDALQLQSALKIRSAALLAARDDAQLIPTLELRIKVGCHLREGEADEIAAQLTAARMRSASPRH